MIATRKFRPAPAACGRLERDEIVALVRGNQRSFGLRMSRLSAVFLLRLRPQFDQPGMRMLRTGRQRRILRRLPQPLEFCFQPGNPLPIVTNDRLDHRADFGRESGKLLRTDRRLRHPVDVTHVRVRANPNFRTRPVNGYHHLIGAGSNRYESDPGLKPFILPENAPDAAGRLYNLATDPGETTNSYFKNPDLVSELETLSITPGHPDAAARKVMKAGILQSSLTST